MSMLEKEGEHRGERSLSCTEHRPTPGLGTVSLVNPASQKRSTVTSVISISKLNTFSYFLISENKPTIYK